MMQQMFLGQVPSLNIEDVFNITVYTGNNTTQSPTTNIDLQNNDGLLWIKALFSGYNHQLYDTLNGVDQRLASDSAAVPATSDSTEVSSFNSDGFTVGGSGLVNQAGNDYIAYSFQKAPKFFDVIKYSGSGTNGRAISHDLGVTPGCIFIKNLTAGNNWMVQHVGSSNGSYLNNNKSFNQTGQGLNATATDFVLSGVVEVNATGNEYIAFIWAEDTPDLIKCGSYAGTGAANNVIDVGFEPQYVWVKAESTSGSWHCVQQQVSRTVDFDSANPASSTVNMTLLSNGFRQDTALNDYNGTNQQYVYMAIAAP